MIEPGRIVMKTAGRETGKYGVIIQKIDDNFALISGPKAITGIKRRKCNIEHLQLTDEKFEIKENITDEELERHWKDSDMIAKFQIPVPIKRHLEKPKKPEKK